MKAKKTSIQDFVDSIKDDPREIIKWSKREIKKFQSKGVPNKKVSSSANVTNVSIGNVYGMDPQQVMSAASNTIFNMVRG